LSPLVSRSTRVPLWTHWVSFFMIKSSLKRCILIY